MSRTTRRWIVEVRHGDSDSSDSVQHFIAAENTPLPELEEWIEDLYSLLDDGEYQTSDYTMTPAGRVVAVTWHHPSVTIVARLGTLVKVDTP